MIPLPITLSMIPLHPCTSRHTNKVMQKQKDYEYALQKSLKRNEEQYAQSNRSQKKALAPGILDLEKRTEQLLKEIEKLTLNVRNEEIKKLKH